jgi:2-methylisocitrate lyase-like PEP mutase family enzyme
MNRHQHFADLHGAGCFVIPNPWDAGSARMMAGLGAAALATSSAAFAFTRGLPDMGRVDRDAMLAHCEDMVAATPLPVSGDLEDGFGAAPETVAETIRLAAAAGLSGASIEDCHARDAGGVAAYPFDLAVERVRAGAAAARAIGRPFVFCARADGVMNGVHDLTEGIRRLQAFEAAGADLLYLPVPPGRAELAQMLAAVRAPVNALAAGPLKGLTVAELAAMGVRRISTGSQIARATHAAIRDAVAGMLAPDGSGHFAGLAGAMSGDEVDRLLTAGMQ